MLFVGVDHGKTGWVVSLDRHGGIDEAEPIPVRRAAKGTDYDARAFLGLMATLARRGIVLLVVERAQAMPFLDRARHPCALCKRPFKNAEGTSGALQKGRGAMLIEAAAAFLDIPSQEVHPATWKHRMLDGAPGEGKARSVAAAEKRWPATSFRGPRGGMLDGKAEAALLAEFARRTHTGAMPTRRGGTA